MLAQPRTPSHRGTRADREQARSYEESAPFLTTSHRGTGADREQARSYGGSTRFLLAAFGAICLTVSACQPREAAAPAPVTESYAELAESDVATVGSGDIGRVLRANGTLRAVQQSSVRAKVAGEIVEVAVREGERVSAGQLLAKIERSEYQSRLDDRRAAFEASRAQAAFAESTRRKNEELRQKNFISTQAYDNAKSAAEVGASQAKSLEAQVALAKKALDDINIVGAGFVA